MIYMDVHGDLGNQLFEYACARQLQFKTGQKICLNAYSRMKKNGSRTDLDAKWGGLPILDYRLNDKVEVTTTEKLPWYADISNPIICVLKKIIPYTFYDFMKRRGVFIWQKEECRVVTDYKFDDYYLCGWFQSTGYFNDISDILREEFEPKYPEKACNKALYDIIDNTESVCVTVRRGNYTLDKFKKKYYLCDPDYFKRAADQMQKMVPDATYVVFSDDVDWCKENIILPGKTYYESGKDEVWEKLRLMKRCKHFIISNSSFSWWAQYLSDNADKKVIAPSRWNTTSTSRSIYDDAWTLIDV